MTTTVRRLILAALALWLAGCGGAGYAGSDRAACVDAGYEPGTEHFDSCVLQIQLQRSQQGPAATVDQMRTLNEPGLRLP